MLPLVTSESLAPGTWLSDVPRICRAASMMRLMPWTYASERLPPLVLHGSRPPTSSPCSSTNSPASPGFQAPYSSSEAATSGVKAAERVGDKPLALVVLDRARLAHHGDGVVGGVAAAGDRDPAQVPRRVTALVEEAAREHRHLIDGADEAVGREERGLVRLGGDVVALARGPGPRAPAGAAVARAVDEHAARHAGRDRRRRVPDHAAPPATAVAHLAEEVQVRHAEAPRDGVLGGELDAPLRHAVDVRRPEPGVLERQLRGLERRHLLRAADVLGEGELADADDRRAVPERHGARLAHRARGRKRGSAIPSAASGRRARRRGPGSPCRSPRPRGR